MAKILILLSTVLTITLGIYVTTTYIQSQSVTIHQAPLAPGADPATQQMLQDAMQPLDTSRAQPQGRVLPLSQ